MRDGGAAGGQRHSEIPDHGWYALGAYPMVTDEQFEKLIQAEGGGVHNEDAWQIVNGTLPPLAAATTLKPILPPPSIHNCGGSEGIRVSHSGAVHEFSVGLLAQAEG